LGIVAIPVLLGITTAQTKEKVTIEIREDEEKVIELPKRPAEEKARADMIEPKVKEVEEAVVYSYDASNKVDPFKSFIVIKKELEEKEEKKPKTYLETLEISQLTISAIVSTSEGNWALVRDSKGDGHIIKVGTSIGKKGGKVIGIQGKQVIVRESHTDFRGRKKIEDIFMRLPEIE